MPIKAAEVKWDQPAEEPIPRFVLNGMAEPDQPIIDAKAVKWDEPSDAPGKLASFGATVGAEFGKVVLGGQKLAGEGIKAADRFVNKLSVSSLVTGKPTSKLGQFGQWLVNDAEQGRRNLSAEEAPYAQANPRTSKSAQFLTDLAITAPVGGLLAKGARAAVPWLASTNTGANLLRAVESSGMAGGNLLSRSAGAAITGGASAAVVDPDSAGMGTVIGGLTPGFFRAAGMTGEAFAGMVRPFFAAGQSRIVADVLRQYANDPAAAVQALRRAAAVVPGSQPTTAAAAGDVGLSGLTRTLQNASPDFAADLANRQTTQNAARTAHLESFAGNPGKTAVAKEARDTATNGMREGVLQRAGDVDAGAIVQSIERMMRDPNNAGQTAQTALRRMRDQVSGAAQDGTINARALYEIRKDAGLAMNGRLQGDAGNLRFARGQLDRVQSMFDDAIEAASRRTVPTGAQIGQGGPRVVTKAQGDALHAADQGMQPQTSWRAYLSRYSELSRPINQMETLQDVLQRIQTGSTDAHGNLVLSAAKLNNILKNETQELGKVLSPEQLQALRNVAADLNASQLAMNSGRSVGSNTVQNLANDQLLQSLMGRGLGGSTPARSTLGNALKLPYIRANQDIQQRLGSALLNPQDAAALIDRTSRPNRLAPEGLRALAHRSPALLSTTGR